MNERKERIGEHAAENALPWAVSALGPVPSDPVDRLDWQRRAASIGAAGEEIPRLVQWITDLAAQHHAFADKLAERQNLMIPAEDPDYQDLGPAFPAWTSPGKDAILQPPKPEIQPSARILERVTDHGLDMEAVD
jgi:hypothetical protein